MKNLLLILIAIISIFYASSCERIFHEPYPVHDTTIILNYDTSVWVYAGMNTGWSSSDTGNSVRYKYNNNIVFLSGISAVSVNAKSTAFTLPVGYRPMAEFYSFARTTAGVSVPFIIYPNGQVYIQDIPTNGDGLSFDNIYFFVK